MPEKQNNAKAEAEKPSQQAGRVKKPKNKPKQKYMEEVFLFFFCTHLLTANGFQVPVLRAVAPHVSDGPRQAAQARWGMRLAAGPSCHRASARSSCKAGSVPAALSWASLGNSRSDEASARCAATVMMPLHRWTQARCAAGRCAGGALAARARATQACGGRPQLPEPSARQPPHRRRRGGSGENALAPGRSAVACGWLHCGAPCRAQRLHGAAAIRPARSG